MATHGTKLYAMEQIELAPNAVIKSSTGNNFVQVTPSGTFVNSKKITVTAKTTTTTLTAAEVLGGLITCNQGAGAVATYTLPTGTLLAAALPTTFAVGDSFEFQVTNISTVAAEDVTIQGGTGTTLKGSGAVASNNAATDISFATFRFVMTGTNTFDVYRVG